jgi:hypothetical protein
MTAIGLPRLVNTTSRPALTAWIALAVKVEKGRRLADRRHDHGEPGGRGNAAPGLIARSSNTVGTGTESSGS